MDRQPFKRKPDDYWDKYEAEQRRADMALERKTEIEWIPSGVSSISGHYGAVRYKRRSDGEWVRDESKGISITA